MAKKHIYWISMDPSEFKRDNDWVYNFSAEQRGVYWHLYVEIADAGGGIDYILEEVALRCKASVDVVDHIIRKKFYLVKHKGRNSKNKPLQIRHKTIDLKIREAKKRISDSEKASKARWQKDAAAYRKDMPSECQKNIKENKREYLKKIYKKKPR
ncbi:MAG: hypothetical protein MI892_01795, partial [Desulfobacterales bacterium]|nr:hypothetical protein [Desulfobacterales bacterium]